MARRHRHLNRTHCGALVDFDTRFITGETNGSNPASWANRGSSSFNLTRSGTAGHLVYDTNQQAGQPRMRFSSTGALLQTSSFSATGNGYGNDHTMISACADAKGNSTQRRLYDWTNSTSNLMQLWAQFSDNIMYLDHRNSTTGRVSASVATTTDVTLISALCDSSSGNVRRNGTQVVSGSRSGAMASGTATLRVGSTTGTAHWVGDFYAFIHGPIGDESIRRRMEQSVAYSFKLSL